MKKTLITIMASLAMFLSTIAQTKLEVTQPSDTVLRMEELADSAWVLTLPDESVREASNRLLFAAIGNEYFSLSYSASRGNIYRLSDGRHVRSVFGERTYFDQSEGVAIEPPSIVADTLGTGYYAHANEIKDWTKRNFFVHLDFATNDTIEVLNVEAMNMRAPWFGNDTIVFANGYTQGFSELWPEYDFSSLGGLYWVNQFGRSCLWLRTKNYGNCLFDTNSGTVRRVTQLSHDGTTYPSSQLIGFGPRHLAIARLKNEMLQLVMFKLKEQ